MYQNLLFNKYKILGKKGEGTFSEVLKCQDVQDNTLWACKKLKHRYKTLEQVEHLREIQAMKKLAPHPNILELREVLFDAKSGLLILVCELMDMNMYELIRGRKQYLPDLLVKKYMYQLCKALYHMHKHGIFHRDIKPENILITEERLKLADFGSCRSSSSDHPYTEYISTRWYRSPECLITDGYYHQPMDVWSVGCVLFEILTLQPLFPGSNEVDQIARIHSVLGTPEPEVLTRLQSKSRTMRVDFPTQSRTGIERLVPNHASRDCLDLIYQLCTYDPDERISAHNALKHSYLKELRKQERRMLANQQKAEMTSSTTTPETGRSTSQSRKSNPDKQTVESNHGGRSPRAVIKENSHPHHQPNDAASVIVSNLANPFVFRYPVEPVHRQKDLYPYKKRDKYLRRAKPLGNEFSKSQKTNANLLPTVTNTNGFQTLFNAYRFRMSNNVSTLPKIGLLGTVGTNKQDSSYPESSLKTITIKPTHDKTQNLTKPVYVMPSNDRTLAEQ